MGPDAAEHPRTGAARGSWRRWSGGGRGWGAVWRVETLCGSLLASEVRKGGREGRDLAVGETAHPFMCATPAYGQPSQSNPSETRTRPSVQGRQVTDGGWRRSAQTHLTPLPRQKQEPSAAGCTAPRSCPLRRCPRLAPLPLPVAPTLRQPPLRSECPVCSRRGLPV